MATTNTEERLDCVMQIVRWLRTLKVDRTISVGFGPYQFVYGEEDNNAWHLVLDKYGIVTFDPIGYYVQYNHTKKEDNSGTSYHHESYADFVEKNEAAVVDLLTEWPRIKARFLAAAEKADNAVKNFAL